MHINNVTAEEDNGWRISVDRKVVKLSYKIKV